MSEQSSKIDLLRSNESETAGPTGRGSGLLPEAAGLPNLSRPPTGGPHSESTYPEAALMASETSRGTGLPLEASLRPAEVSGAPGCSGEAAAAASNGPVALPATTRSQETYHSKCSRV